MARNDGSAQLAAADNATQLVSIWKAWARQETPPGVEGHLELARRLHELNRPTTAIEVLAAAHERWPDDADVAHRLGWRLRQAGDLDGATAALERAIVSNPDHVDALGILGGIHKRRGQTEADAERRRELFERARALYARAHAIIPEDRYPLAGLGGMDAVLRSRETDEGRKWYRRIVELVPAKGSDEWDRACLAEAALVLGEPDVRKRYEPLAATASQEVIRSAADQLAFLAQNDVRLDDCEAILSDVLLPALGESSDATRGPLLLHLSDIHFGKKDGVRMHRFGSKPIEAPLVDQIAETWTKLEDAAGRPTILVVSGDLAYEADEDEFDEVAAFLEGLRERLDLSPRQIVLVPGNHDVNWKDSEADHIKRLDRYIAFLGRVYGDEKDVLYPHIHWREPAFGKRKTTADSILAVHDLSAEAGLVIVGLNSCAEESHKDHYGFVSHVQLDRMTDVFSKCSRHAIRVVVLHHHVLPIEDSVRFVRTTEGAGGNDEEQAVFDVSLVRNSAILERRLHRAGVDIVLHGHKHQPALRQSLLHDDQVESPKPLVICSAGSTSVIHDEVPPGYGGNHFSILRFPRCARLPHQPFVAVDWWHRPFNDTDDWSRKRSWSVLG